MCVWDLRKLTLTLLRTAVSEIKKSKFMNLLFIYLFLGSSEVTMWRTPKGSSKHTKLIQQRLCERDIVSLLNPS